MNQSDVTYCRGLFKQSHGLGSLIVSKSGVKKFYVRFNSFILLSFFLLLLPPVFPSCLRFFLNPL